MLDCIIVICAIFGLAFLIKENDGPWGIIAKSRNFLMSNKYVGVFFYKLLDCYFCLGCYCGSIIYLLHEKYWTIQLFILWALAGGIISLFMSALISKLYQ